MFDKDNKFGFINNNNESNNNNIEGLDKVKTDLNNIKSEVNELNTQYKDIENKKSTKKDIYIKDYPLLNNEKDNERINRVIQIAKQSGIKDVYLEPNETYTLYEKITLEENLNLHGMNSTIIRNVDRTVTYGILICNGNNIVDELNINGGADSYNKDGEFINYCDIYILGNNVSIKNSKFDKSAGSSIRIKNTKDVYIYNNIFNSYLDHSIYLRNGNNEMIENVCIYNNTFYNQTSRRNIIKFATNVKNCNVYSNMFYTPESNILVVEDACDNINFFNNNGECLELLEGSVSKNESNNINIINNNIIIYQQVLKLFKMPDANSQNGVNIKKINIKNNTFQLQHSRDNKPFLINGDVNNSGIEICLIENNTIYSPNEIPRMFFLIGKIETIIFKNNKIISEYYLQDKYSNPLITFNDTEKNNANLTNYVNYNTGKIIFENNYLCGRISPIFFPAYKEVVQYDIVVKDNIFNSDIDTRFVTNFNGTLSSIDKKIYTHSNISISGNNIEVGHWNSSNIITV